MTLALEVLAHPVEVVCEDPGVDRIACEVFADLLGATSIGPERILVPGAEPLEALWALASALDSAVVRFGSGALMPRAAALARPDGSVALICGPPGGTSPLTVALLRLGCAYLADGTTVLDPATLEVSPFPRPLALPPSAPRGADARPSWAGADEPWLVRASTLGGAVLPQEPLEVRLVVDLRSDRDAAHPPAEPLSAGEVAHLVGARCSDLGAVTGGPLPAVARLARRVRAVRVSSHDPRAAAEEVLRLWQTA